MQARPRPHGSPGDAKHRPETPLRGPHHEEQGVTRSGAAAAASACSPPRRRARPAEQVALRLVQPSRRSSSSCAAVSTPSAVVTMPRLLPRPITARTIAIESSRVASSRDEGAVDLDLVEREAAQIAQRRIAGAEIVERDPDAERAQLGAGPRASPRCSAAAPIR